MSESKIQHDIRLALAQRGDCVFWRNQTGLAVHYKGGRRCPTCNEQTLGARKFHVPYGLCKGSSDLIGLVPIVLADVPVAVFVGLEVKTCSGRVSEEQKLFGSLVRHKHGWVEAVRSVEDAMVAVETVRGWGSK